MRSLQHIVSRNVLEKIVLNAFIWHYTQRAIYVVPGLIANWWRSWDQHWVPSCLYPLCILSCFSTWTVDSMMAETTSVSVIPSANVWWESTRCQTLFWAPGIQWWVKRWTAARWEFIFYSLIITFCLVYPWSSSLGPGRCMIKVIAKWY